MCPDGPNETADLNEAASRRRTLRAAVVIAGLLAGLAPVALMNRAAAAPSAPFCPVPAWPTLAGIDCLSTGNPDMTSFADLSWRAFRFVTWPTSWPDTKTHPLRGQAAPPGQTKPSPPVFLTFKADWETFRAFALPPLAWASYQPTANVCKTAPAIAPGDLVLSSVHEFGNVKEPNFSKMTNVLVGQNGKVVHYMTSFGPEEFGVILNNQLYDAAKNLPPGPGAPLPVEAAMPSSIVVKTAWLEITPGSGPVHPFYTRQALIRDFSSNTCTSATVGLVAMHIALKTPRSPQWVWASFEHVDNVPDDGGPAPWTFHDATPDMMKDTPPTQDVIDPAGPGTTPTPFQPIPFNVNRKFPIADDIKDRNTFWQTSVPSALSNPIWSNYQLVTVQWPSLHNQPLLDATQVKPTPPCSLNSDFNKVNTTMETFLQAPSSCQQLETTCMGCHNSARTSDFVWSIPMNAQRRLPFFRESEDRLRALVRLRDIVGLFELPGPSQRH